MSKIYYNGNTNHGFTYEDIKKVYDILGCDEEALAELVTRGYDGDYDEGLNCDTYVDYSTDSMITMFYELNVDDEVSPASHWADFLWHLKNDHQYGSSRLWHRALNVGAWNNDLIDQAKFDSDVTTFCDMIESNMYNDDLHCAMESVWLAQFEEEPEDLPSFEEVRKWYLTECGVDQSNFSKSFSKEVFA